MVEELLALEMLQILENLRYTSENWLKVVEKNERVFLKIKNIFYPLTNL